MNASAAAEPYVTEFEARIDRVDGREVVLDRTYFYAEGGGQPADRGEIDGVAVRDVQTRDGTVVHSLADGSGVETGRTVACEIDPAFRTYCMRTHTASHVLYGAGRRLLDDLGYGGFDIDERKARIDFETSTDIDDDVLIELEVLANRTVWEGRPVTWETVPVADARAREAVAFNTRTEEGVFEEDRGVRIVSIGADRTPTSTAESWDDAACGGTHVSNTREIGPISVLGRSNPGEGLTRVELAVGPAAIEHRTETRRAAERAARELGVGVPDLPAEIRRRRERITELEDERAALLGRIADARIDALGEDVLERDGERWLVGSVPHVDSDTLLERARALAGGDCEVAALVSDERPTTAVVASANGTDAGAVIDALTSEFGGGGGGGEEFAQGGGIAAEPAEVVSFLRDP
ncbi:alanyl-tRNA editing protein [Halalkalicoccus jeotgali]|uniref:Alanyl-tRNA synthetase n=1 Tax=Halalkalicoccus jeotgali (strain DSM 18796 / CECT 7217 / JCM 14584 / KCTC 4019 / B3) TaxID=795797 RepID=D8J3B7_HALJB|nr:alanyl-tRNA editing protein [Halalkalicoccus jeotgali]ADJ15224.1 alanyl-tRNA synthetase [Halalkalicoccus jeotgali B3]ELY35199.1 alanyl-tRNA synthetase [Halalkalicoccus jeotgali B3]